MPDETKRPNTIIIRIHLNELWGELKTIDLLRRLLEHMFGDRYEMKFVRRKIK